MESRKIRREKARKAWKEKYRQINKNNRASFQEYWKDQLELLHGNKLTRLLRNKRKS